MPSTCLVSAKDYARYWAMPDSPPVPTRVPYEGPERRASGRERRTAGHDRRWEMMRGRRYRAADRRRLVNRAG